MIPQRLEQIGLNLGRLFNGFFDYTYNEHKGPIQVIHQIERVRSSAVFEADDFYRIVVEELLHTDTARLTQIIQGVDQNVDVWKHTVIMRQVQMQAVARVHGSSHALGDLVWLAYLYVETGMDKDVIDRLAGLERIMQAQIEEDDGVFYHTHEFTRCREYNEIHDGYLEVLKRLRSVS